MPKKLLASFLLVLLNLSPVSSFGAEKQQAPARDAQWVNQVFQKGKTYYESGDYTSATKEWNKLDPYLDQYPSFKKVIGYLKSQVLTGSGTTLKSSSESAPEPLGIQKTFGEAESNLQTALQTAIQEKSKLKGSNAEQESWIRSTLRKGQVAYENGNWEVALEEWKKIEPFLDPASPEAAELNKVRRSYEMVQLANKQNEQILTQKKAELKTPPEFMALMQNAEKKLEAQVLEMQNRQESIEKDSVFEEAWVNTTFERGKAAYEAGNYDQALEEWDKLSFKLKDQPEIASQIDRVKEARRNFREAELKYSKSADDLSVSGRTADPEMTRFLKQAASDLRSKADEMSRQGSEKQQSLSDQQNQVNATFERGKALYLQGKHKEALDEWMLLSSYFEGDPTLKAAFLSAQGSVQAHEYASNTYQQSLDSGAYKLRLPDGFFRFVENANKELTVKTRGLEDEKKKTELAVSSKRVDLMQAYDRGKNFYAQGQIADAITEWRKITPWVENGEEFQAELQKMEANYQEASAQGKSLREAQAKSSGVYSPPAEFAQLLSTVNQDLKNQTQTATNERLVTQQSLSEKQARISGILYKASLAQKAGKIDQAIAGWEQLLPYLDPTAQERTLIENLKQNYAEYAEAVEANRDTRKKKESLVELPDDLKRNLIKTNDELLKKIDQSKTAQQLSDREFSEKNSTVLSAMEKGKLFYQAGRLDQAISEWEKLTPFMESASQDAILIEQLKNNYSDSLQAQQQLASSSAKQKVNPELPGDLRQRLTQTSQELLQKSTEARTQKEAIESDSQASQAIINSAMERGRLYYQAGRLNQAIPEWEKMMPYMDKASQDRLLIENLRNTYADLYNASEELKKASVKKDWKFSLPEDLKNLFSKTTQDLITKSSQARSQRDGYDRKLEESRANVQSATEKGRLFYQAGRMDQAISEWEKLTPYMDESSQDRILIEELKHNYSVSMDASKALQSAQSKKDFRAVLPDDLKKILTQTNEEIIHKISKAQTDKKLLDANLSDKQSAVLSAIDKSRLFYQAGRLDQALTEWEKLKPYFSEASEERLLIENLRQTYADSVQASKDLEASQTNVSERAVLPDDVKKIIADSNQDLQTKTEKIRTDRQGLETKYQEQQTWFYSTLEKAKVYAQAGRYKEASEEWNKVANGLDPQSDAGRLIQNFNANVIQHELAKQSFQEALAKKDMKWPVPENLSSLLDSTQKVILLEQEQLLASKASMQKDLEDRGLYVESVFQKGKALLDQGQQIEAIYEWEKLLPYLDQASAIQTLLDSAKKSWQELQNTKKSNEIFMTTQYNDLKMPFTTDMEKILREAGQKLVTEQNAVQTERLEKEKTLSERQVWVQSTFEKGKAYFDAGKNKEAIEYWSSMSPYLNDEAKVQSLIAGLPDRYQNLLEVQKAAETAALSVKEPLPPPAELPKLLTDLQDKINAQHLEALSRAEKAKQSAEARQASMNQLFAQGESLAQQGDWDGAIKAWSELPTYVQDEAKVKAALDNLRASYQNYVTTKKDAADAEDRLAARIATPADLGTVLTDAAFKLDKERQTTQLSLERTNTIVSEKEAAVQKIYQEGKTRYDEGKLADAFAAWRSMLPSLKDEKELGEILNKADESYQTYLLTKTQNQTSLSKKEMKLEAPAELSQILESANTKLRDDIFDLKNRTSQTEKMIDDRRSWIGVTFEKGKLAFSQGRYQDAVAEWKTVLPFVENGAQFEKGISDFERNMAVSLEASKINVEAENKRNAKFQSPDEMGVLLIELNEKVKNQALEANAEKIRSQQEYSERQKWIKETFEVGKNLYQQEKFDEAIAEWEKLAPYLEAQEGTQKLIEAVKLNVAASKDAKKGAVESAAQDYQGLKLPYAEQMTQLLSEANEKLKKEAVEYASKKNDLEKTMAERQEWSVTTFNKGKVYYDEERYEEALNQWERLLPYLSNGSAIKEQIQSLRTYYNTILAGKNALGETGGAQPAVKLNNEQELLGVLEEASLKFKSEADTAKQKELEVEKSFEQRKEWIEYTFKKGKDYYDQGNYAKAVEEWGVLGPYLGEHPKVRDMIEEAKKNYTEGRYAKQIIETMEAKKSALLALPVQEAAVPTPAQSTETAEPTSEPAQPVETQTVAETTPSDNSSVQLVTGEVVSVDEPERKITLKIISESGTSETLVVNFDEKTEMGGASSKPLSTIPSGASIDVRYNPQTSQALYVYIY